MEEWESRIIDTDKGVVRLRPVANRARELFGAAGADSMADEIESNAASSGQLSLFPDEAPTVRGRARRGRRAAVAPVDDTESRRDATTLDRVHAAMLLQASGRTEALRNLIRAEQDRGPGLPPAFERPVRAVPPGQRGKALAGRDAAGSTEIVSARRWTEDMLENLRKSRFSDLTLLAAVDLFRWVSQSELDRQILYLSLDSDIPIGSGMSKENKANMMAKLVKDYPYLETTSDNRLDEEIVKWAAQRTSPQHPSAFSRALARDGFTLTEKGSIVSSLPEIADIQQANDELFSLLEELNFPVAKGHLNQAITNHGTGNWASANSQLRTFLEEAFNEISKRLDSEKGEQPLTSYQRRMRLAQMDMPFLEKSLGEWDDNSVSFIHGIFRRLNPEGSHPGLSDDEDCTFRLHMILIIGRHYLRRLKNRLS